MPVSRPPGGSLGSRRVPTHRPGLYPSSGAVLAVRVDESRMRPTGGDGSASPRPGEGPAVTQAVVRVDRRGDAAYIAVTGEVDMANAKTAERQILHGISENLTTVTLDLTDLDYIDSAGLWVLFRLGAYLTAARIAGEVLVPAEGPVLRMVETAGVAAAIPIRQRRQ